MKKILIALSILTLSMNIASCQSPYENVVEYLKNDLKFNEFCNLLEINVDKIEVSNEFIPFNCESVLENYIQKEHIKNFSIFNSELLDKHKTLIEAVSDSLSDLSKKLNNLECGRENNLPNMKEIQSIGAIIYFSKYSENYIYLEVLGYNSQFFENKEYKTVALGQALTYLFEFKDGKIRKAYWGEVNHQ